MRETSGIDEYHAVNVRKRPSSTTADAAVPLPPREGFGSDKLKFVLLEAGTVYQQFLDIQHRLCHADAVIGVGVYAKPVVIGADNKR